MGGGPKASLPYLDGAGRGPISPLSVLRFLKATVGLETRVQAALTF